MPSAGWRLDSGGAILGDESVFSVADGLWGLITLFQLSTHFWGIYFRLRRLDWETWDDVQIRSQGFGVFFFWFFFLFPRWPPVFGLVVSSVRQPLD
jgi:hypothetical protein